MVTNFLLSFMSSSMGKRSVLDALEKTSKTVPAAEAPAPTEVAPEAAPEKAQEAAPEKAKEAAPPAPNAEAPHEPGAAQ